MSAKSPLARFFAPVGGGGKQGSPHTPAPRNGGSGREADAEMPPAGAPSTAVTPPRATELRKRPGAGAGDGGLEPDAKKPRPGAEAETPGAGVSPPSAAQTPRIDDEGLCDLRATLDKAQKASQGSLPPFTAEIFHYYATGGAQYSWPPWLMPENLKDANGRVPTDPAFNPCTLWVPDEKTQKAEKSHGTPMLLQYWKLKAAHFDKVAFFKVGKFYELFYYDAFVAQRVCDLKWMGEKKPHVGFPEMAKHDYAKQIVDAGYKVVVVEQVERVAEQKERKGAANAQGPSCVEREACEVFTSGTLVDPELLGGAAARFMVCFHFQEDAHTQQTKGGRFAACLVDCATSQIQLGVVQDSPDRNALRTLLAQVQPSEVVYSVSNVPPDVLTLIKRLPCRPQLSPWYQTKSGDDIIAARSTISKYRLAHDKKLDGVEGVLADEGGTIAAAATINYLESVLLGRRVLPFATWEALAAVHNPLEATPSKAGGTGVSRRLVLDATALHALEVFETLEGTYKGSLLHFLNHTSTEFGFRLLKQWLCAPLFEIDEIRTRGEAVEFFVTQQELAQQLRAGLKKVPIDLERVTSRIWSFALQAERHAVMYEDVTAKRLGEFRSLMQAYEQCLHLLTTLLPSNSPLPSRVQQITRTRSQGGCFPDLQSVITEFTGSIVEDRSGTKVKFKPQAGAFKPYDDFTKQIQAVEASLDKELAKIKKQFPGVALTYVHRLPGYRYEVECEATALPQSFLKGVEETFRNKAKVRFHTPSIKELIEQLQSLEDKREDCVFPFLAHIFRQFHGYQAQFRAAVRNLAELDALLSLAAASKAFSGASCRAELVDVSGPESMTTLEVRGCRHPVAAAKMGTSFVPNDTLLNACGVPNVLVVTGPNMGGKSTVLRQTCIAVILAQIGCRVNAERCRLSPVDRIFTRIGSYDTIMEGKSTLLTELEETSSILAHGTRRSLAVLDELGRGTSTFDGAAIASAVLDELSTNVNCLVLFATHYHPVSREAAKCPSVAPFHMAAAVDEKTSEMTFLYRFLPGLCPASHGHNVARLAGLPAQVLQEALAKSEEFEGGEGRAHDFLVEAAKLAEAGDTTGLRGLFERRPRPPAAPAPAAAA